MLYISDINDDSKGVKLRFAQSCFTNWDWTNIVVNFLLRFVPRSLDITKLVMVHISVPWTNYGIVYCHMYMSICLNKWTWLENTTNITPILLIAVKLVLLDLLWLTDLRRRTIPVKYDCHQNIHDGLFCCYLSEKHNHYNCFMRLFSANKTIKHCRHDKHSSWAYWSSMLAKGHLLPTTNKLVPAKAIAELQFR